MSRLSRIPLLLALAVMLPGMNGCSTTQIHQNPDFAAKTRVIRTVNIVPPDVEFTYRTFSGDDKRMRENEDSMAASLSDSLATQMKSNGYQVNSAVSRMKNLGDQDQRFQFEQLRTAYNKLSEQLYAHGSVSATEAKNCRLSVGPIVNQFATGADGVFILRYQGYQKSDGLQRKDMAASILLMALMGAVPTNYQPPPDVAGTVEIALLDGTTGDVLWVNRWSEGTWSMESMVKGTMTEFPKWSAATTSVSAQEKVHN